MLPTTFVICSLLAAVAAKEIVEITKFENRLSSFIDTKNLEIIFDGGIGVLNGTVYITQDLGDDIMIAVLARYSAKGILSDVSIFEVLNACNVLSGKDHSKGAKILLPIIKPFGKCPIKKGTYPFDRVTLDKSTFANDAGDRIDVDFTIKDNTVVNECDLYLQARLLQ